MRDGYGSFHPDAVADRKFRQEAAERAKNLLREYLYMAGVPCNDFREYEIGELVEAIISAARGLK